jgi:hypothetical protein
MTQDEALRVAMDWYGSGNQDPDEFEKLIKAIAAKRTWVGLTDSEMLECLKAVDVATAVNLLISQYEMPPTFKVYAQAIEAKLKEKNNG